MTTTQTNADHADALLIVGIGASAGGLDAFSEILSHLPTDTGMAFVLVQHMDPTQESFLGELLGRTTDMPVSMAQDGVRVQANHVYVIPPDAGMTIAQGQLHLTACDQSRQRSRTVDRFLRSLAEDCRNRAVAVVLSGSNDDGAIGIRAIREKGGITFAQDRSTAEYPTMPGAAIATGQVDFVLPPVQIAEELVKISQHPYVCEPTSSESEDTVSFQDGDLRTVFGLLRRQTKIDFSRYKRTTFERRMRRRMALHKTPRLGDYIQYLQDHPEEIRALYRDVLITVTEFFRDPEVFTRLKDQVFTEILHQPGASDSIRIWVAGCATGEEAYSVAICLLECLDSLQISPAIQIFGTDISDLAIEEARTGFYRESQMENVSLERRRRFFIEGDDGYRINKAVRELCVFAQHDLSSDPPFSGIDLITCRNVLIYFQSQLQQSVLSVFHYSLKPSGFLVLGTSESVGDNFDLFEAADAQAKIYTPKAVPSRVNFDFVSSYPDLEDLPQPASFSASINRSGVQQWADQIVLNRYGPVGVIVNDALDIIQFRGDTSPYLRPPLGDPSFNLLKMVRPGLSAEVRAVIEQVQQRGVAIVRQGLQLEEPRIPGITLEVIPFNVSQGRCFLVLFGDSTESSLTESRSPMVGEDAVEEDNPEVVQLRRDLATVRQELLDTQTYLQITVEEQESMYQQLVAANEEVLSSNEELRSTNEELQTAKEEIQSANEELKTTNEELQSRNTEARRAHDDLVNLVNNVNIPLIMLSADLHVRSFSPAAQEIFNLIPSDVGRPISNIRPNVEIPQLEVLIRQVMATLSTIEQEVQDATGHWYLMRIRPYRTIDNRIDGAVLALLDINNLKRTEQNLRDIQAQLETSLFVMDRVQALSLRLFSSLDLRTALDEILDAVMAILHAESGSVQLFGPEEDDLTITVRRGIDDDLADLFTTVSTGDDSVWDRALRQGQRVVIGDIDTDSNFEPYRAIAAMAGYRAMQSTPLISHDGTLLGIISTFFAQPYRPSEQELRLLDIYAVRAAELIELIHSERERQQLRTREQAAREANASKDEFLSVLSHELRTPLNSILGWSQIILDGPMQASDLERAIASIHNSAQTQLRLVEDLLDTSRIVQDRFSIQLQPVNLNQLLEQAIASIQPQANEKSLQLDIHLDESPGELMADTDRMEQVFSNLLSNAVKFTPEGGCITVTLVYLPSQVQVQISDTGQGIAPGFLPNVFDRFRQSDSSNVRKTGGLGLGLFLVRSIVHAHNGTIQATSAGLGQGATFSLTLPWITPESSSLETKPPERDTEDISLAGTCILLVDDTEDNLTLYTYVLYNLGATVLTAKTAAEALDVIDIQPVEVLVSDIGLPSVNGYELIRQVRSLPDESKREIPAIALTGYASEQDVQRALAAGFQRHLAKPVDLGGLVAAIYSLIRTL